MSKTLVIQPVTRIEGHAKMTIQLNDARQRGHRTGERH